MGSSQGAAYPHLEPQDKGNVYMNNTSKISSLKTLRLKNETIEYFKGKPLNKLVDNLLAHEERGDIKIWWEDFEVVGAVKGVDPKVAQDLEIIGKIDGMTFGDMFNELHRALDEGEIEIVEGRFTYPMAENEGQKT